MNPDNSDKSNNCIAYKSATHQHNGQWITLGENAAQGARGAEIKALQAECNSANENGVEE